MTRGRWIKRAKPVWRHRLEFWSVAIAGLVVGTGIVWLALMVRLDQQ